VLRARSKALDGIGRAFKKAFGPPRSFSVPPGVNAALAAYSILQSTSDRAMSIDLDAETTDTDTADTKNEPVPKGNVANAAEAGAEEGIDLPSITGQAKSYWRSFKDSASRRAKNVQNQSAEETGKAAAETAEKAAQETVGFLRGIFNNAVAGTTAAVLGAVKGAGMGISQIRVLARRLQEDEISPEHLVGEWTDCHQSEDGELVVTIESEHLPESEVGLGKAIERELALPVPQGEGYTLESREAILIPYRVEGDNSAFAVLDNEQGGGPVYFWVDDQ
jgi:hypothetical protein